MVKQEKQDIELITLKWNSRYERSKIRLVQCLEALARHADPEDLEKAKKLIAAVQRLPEVIEGTGGSLRLENRVAKRVGDSDFVYHLSLDEYGFGLSYIEYMLYDENLREHTSILELVRCNPLGCEDGSSCDEEALEMMRETVEMMFGPVDDDEWEQQVEAAYETDDIEIPNGIESWLEMLEMLPLHDDGSVPKTVTVKWKDR